MGKEFNACNLPEIRWYIGQVVEDQGQIKLEWTDPAYGPVLYTEEQLAMIEQSARDMLVHRHEEVVNAKWGGWTIECHTFWRDRHYNAEYGLALIQDYKKSNDMNLDTTYRPVIK